MYVWRDSTGRPAGRRFAAPGGRRAGGWGMGARAGGRVDWGSVCTADGETSQVKNRVLAAKFRKAASKLRFASSPYSTNHRELWDSGIWI